MTSKRRSQAKRRSSCSAGPFTDRAPVRALRPLTSFWTQPWHGLTIPIHGSERLGERGSAWPGSSPRISTWNTSPTRPVSQLLRALGVKGQKTELRSASDEFSGHCLALTLLGSYLTDAYDGDIRCREEVSNRLAQDVRQGAHAQKVMASYQSWFGEGPELSVLRLLGLFARPADEKALGALLNPPAIRGPDRVIN
jgi:hypothetical protein